MLFSNNLLQINYDILWLAVREQGKFIFPFCMEAILLESVVTACHWQGIFELLRSQKCIFEAVTQCLRSKFDEF